MSASWSLQKVGTNIEIFMFAHDHYSFSFIVNLSSCAIYQIEPKIHIYGSLLTSSSIFVTANRSTKRLAVSNHTHGGCSIKERHIKKLYRSEKHTSQGQHREGYNGLFILSTRCAVCQILSSMFSRRERFQWRRTNYVIVHPWLVTFPSIYKLLKSRPE
jgi:hypothetical protein